MIQNYLDCLQEKKKISNNVKVSGGMVGAGLAGLYLAKKWFKKRDKLKKAKELARRIRRAKLWGRNPPQER